MNVDKNKLFPSQTVDGDPTECVGLVVADIAGNIDGRAYDPDFIYAMTLLLEGVEPTTGGSDPFTGMQAAVAYGLLPASEETFTALSAGELYVANSQNYTPAQRRDALAYAKTGVKNLLGSGDDFADIKAYVEKTGWGASVRVTWFSSFLSPVAGVLPNPSGGITDHDIAVYGTTVIDGVEYLIAKPWMGKDYGDGGYCYVGREMINTICEGAWGFDPDAKRWYSLIGIAITKYSYLQDYVTQLMTLEDATADPDYITEDWTNPVSAHHNVRALCDLEGLTYEKKQELTACVKIESDFLVNAVNRNYAFRSDGTRYVASTDNGICQWNDYYHATEITPDEALHDPEKAIRLMCQYWKAGKMNQWVSYSSGAYLKFLGTV